MSKVRINDLARELEVKPRAILDVLPELGVTETKTHSSSLEADEADRVRTHFGHTPSRPANYGSSASSRGAQTVQPKIDLSHISKPGDALKAILAKKQEDELAARRSHAPAKPAAPPAAQQAAAPAGAAAKPAPPVVVAAHPPAAAPRPEPRKIVPAFGVYATVATLRGRRPRARHDSDAILPPLPLYAPHADPDRHFFSPYPSFSMR